MHATDRTINILIVESRAQVGSYAVRTPHKERDVIFIIRVFRFLPLSKMRVYIRGGGKLGTELFYDILPLL